MRERYDLAAKLARMALVTSARGSLLAANGAAFVADDELPGMVEREPQPANVIMKQHHNRNFALLGII
jgi:hypothetical protein